MSVFPFNRKHLNRDELIAIAKRISEQYGWTWLEPIGIQNQMNSTRQPLAPAVQKFIERRAGFSAAEPSESAAYIRLNRQTPCPPRSAVSVNQAYGLGFSPTVSRSPLIMAATNPAMSAD